MLVVVVRLDGVEVEYADAVAEDRDDAVGALVVDQAQRVVRGADDVVDVRSGPES